MQSRHRARCLLNRGLADDPRHWPLPPQRAGDPDCSSYAFYQQRGEVLIEIDPAD